MDSHKVYWTEQTGTNRGRIRSANLDGTGVSDAYTVTATVHGLALDPAANNQLYWTNGWGKVQRGAPSRDDVVTGLMTPTALAIGGASTTGTPQPVAQTPTIQTVDTSKYDVNGDGTVDNGDVLLIALAVGTSNTKYDVNADDKVDDKDIVLVRDNRDEGAAAAPMIVGNLKLTTEQVDRIKEQINLLIVTSDRSPAALKTLVYLQQLIATAHPEKTQLLANYPNPFNPETWIPYHLAEPADVTVSIYTVDGKLVRRLDLGHQLVGMYESQSRAAYWDGRNALGEPVASGVYFYTLTAGEFTATRKMLIQTINKRGTLSEHIS